MAKTTINAAALHSALDAARQERQLSWRALAGEIGVSPSLLSRLGNGLKPDYLGEVLGTFSLRANFCTKTLASAIEAHYGQMI